MTTAENQVDRIHLKINHSAKVAMLAKKITLKNNLGFFLALDINRWGINAPYTDMENHLIYRKTISHLSNDTFYNE